MFTDYYKGRIMLYDIMYKIPYRVFHFLYVELFKKLESDDGKKEISYERMLFITNT